jgi:hypothetical protein
VSGSCFTETWPIVKLIIQIPFWLVEFFAENHQTRPAILGGIQKLSRMFHLWFVNH